MFSYECELKTIETFMVLIRKTRNIVFNFEIVDCFVIISYNVVVKLTSIIKKVLYPMTYL